MSKGAKGTLCSLLSKSRMNKTSHLFVAQELLLRLGVRVGGFRRSENMHRLSLAPDSQSQGECVCVARGSKGEVSKKV